MTQPFDAVIPLFKPAWCTRAVFEGLTERFGPRAIHVIAPADTVDALDTAGVSTWATAPVTLHREESFFEKRFGLSKADLADVLELPAGSLYTPGWFFQQLLKLGVDDGIPDISDPYLVWDGDTVPLDAWPPFDGETPAVAFLQHASRGNPTIVAAWADWIRIVLGVEPATDPTATFITHHGWFHHHLLASFRQQLSQHLDSTDPWPMLMMRTANQFGTFSEFWAYASWVKAHESTAIHWYDYDRYGTTTERFFEDGTSIFAAAYQRIAGHPLADAPSHADLAAAITQLYEGMPTPSCISFEQSPRHLQKATANMHLEETRSRWTGRA